MTHTKGPWKAGNYGTSKRPWFCLREVDSITFIGMEYLLDKRGQVRWFASYKTAINAANKATESRK